jgi:hypothetical protein
MGRRSLKTSSKTIGIIGYGEIGQALDDIYLANNFVPLIKDLERDDELGGVHVLNICIPFSYDFVAQVSEYIDTLKPGLTIIHSTVPPGTTKLISADYPNVTHSPVRGVHPNLAEGIHTFVKVFGGAGAIPASKHFTHDLGIECGVYESSTTTEVAKLLDTSYYGVCIAWHDYASKLCDMHGVDFEEAQTHYNSTYNSGYTELGKPNVVRPTLIAPEGSIGGHCIVPNAEILRCELDSKLLEAVTDLK